MKKPRKSLEIKVLRGFFMRGLGYKPIQTIYYKQIYGPIPFINGLMINLEMQALYFCAEKEANLQFSRGLAS
ncbi:hypothetical protein AM592_06640 [Bacillus gobiensis]|uniref:Uncharacterized protein n=1 Tax=Bacillus gobiensis TaxID=1441095 RepID=A0A0M4FT70_9BACI|nr:hypothetical protein AM592_06640 [Bacillus gobiensis]